MTETMMSSSLLICRSRAIRLLLLPPLPLVRARLDLFLDFDPYGATDPLGKFPLF